MQEVLRQKISYLYRYLVFYRFFFHLNEEKWLQERLNYEFEFGNEKIEKEEYRKLQMFSINHTTINFPDIEYGSKVILKKILARVPSSEEKI